MQYTLTDSFSIWYMHLCDIIRKLTSDRLVVECFVAFSFFQVQLFRPR